MIREVIWVWSLLAVAALLESGGDALVRHGLRGARWGLLLGPVALVLYGFVVNLAKWDFSRLMGAYIAVFFLVSQAIAMLLFRERIQPPVLVGGTLIVVGGLILTFWAPGGK